MQTYILTIQISTVPKQDFQKAVSTIFVKVLNSIKGINYYHIKAVAKGNIAQNIVDLYRKGDYLIIESHIQYDSNIESNILVITREHPIFLSK